MLEILIVLALIVLNAFFAMSEMALMTSRKLRLKQLAEDPAHPSRAARKALALVEHPDRLLSTVQVGITLIGVLTGVFGVLAGGLITAAQVIFGELIPKRLALTNPERIACAVAIPLSALSTAATPVVAALGAINRAVLRMLGIRDDARSAISEEEIRLLVSESHEQGVIDADERKMMNRVLGLGDRLTDSLMTPRTRISWLDADAPLDENLAAMRQSPFSRFPVLRGSDQDVVGVVEAKSLLRALAPGVPIDLFGDMREALFVSESTHALKLLEIFREEQQSLALVVDEYGDVTGLVTVNDVMGAVIGRIQAGMNPASESFDEHSSPVVERGDGSWLVDGSLHVEDLRELVGSTVPGEDEHDFHTAAGMVIAHYGRIPNVGEHFSWPGWRVEVVDLDGPRIDKLLLYRESAQDLDNDDTSG